MDLINRYFDGGKLNMENVVKDRGDFQIRILPEIVAASIE